MSKQVILGSCIQGKGNINNYLEFNTNLIYAI